MEAIPATDIEFAHILVRGALKAFGLHRIPVVSQSVGRAIYPSILRLSQKMLSFDQVVAERSLWEATQLLLPAFVNQVDVQGAEKIPQEGPLLVTANHPGAADVLLLFAAIRRRDVKIVAGVEELRYMPNTWNRHIIFVEKGKKHAKPGEARQAITQSLKQGACVLLFPRGKMEPDPRWMQGAEKSLRYWSRSIESFASAVPDLQVLPAAIGGVVNPNALKFPVFGMLGSHKRRQRAAVFTQIIAKMLRNEWFQVQAQIAFGDVLNPKEITAEEVLQAIHTRAQALFPAMKSEQWPLVNGVSGWW